MAEEKKAQKAEKKGENKGEQKAPKKAKGGAPAESAEAKPREKRKPLLPSELERRYKTEIVSALMSQFGYKNRMQVPRLEKIVINTSIKEALQDVKVLETACSEIGAITGQRPMITKAKKSISNFKLRKGQSIGAVVWMP